MKEKVLEIIKATNLDDLNLAKNFFNILQSQALSKIIVKDNKVIFVIDIGLLEINKKDAAIIAKRYQEEIEKNTGLVANIILTDDGSYKAADQSSYQSIPNQQNQQNRPSEQKPFNPEKIVGVNKVIAVASGKGGVGKSTVVVNLALSLRRIGFKVAIVDADIYGPSISHLMNLVDKPKIEDSLMIPINSYGIECISVGSLIDGSAAGIWRGPMITKILYQLIRGTRWHDKNSPTKDEIDYMIIDFPPGTGDIHLSMIQKFPITGAVIVSTPSELAIIDVIKSIDMFKKLNIPILGVIQNMSYLLDKDGNKNYLFGKDQAKKMAEELKLNFLGDIPLDSKIRESGDQKTPIVVTEPASEISMFYGQIAENIIDNMPNTRLMEQNYD